MAVSGLNPLAALTALLAGFLSFASPCVLPLLPGYLAFITGRSADELRQGGREARQRVLLNAGAFVLGLAVIFVLLGATATLLGETLLTHLPLLWRIGGVLVVVLGLNTLGIIKIPLLARSARFGDAAPDARSGATGALVLGLAFGAGWTPCVGPVLAGLLTLASTQSTVGAGMLLLFVYALGLGIPFLAAGLAVDAALAVVRGFRPYLRGVEMVSGVLLLAIGALLFTDRFSLLSAWMVSTFGTGLSL